MTDRNRNSALAARLKSRLDSPVLNSWLVFGLKPLNFLLLVPLILKRLETEEVAAFYLFTAATGLMMIMSFGFNSTFIRLLGYLVNGVSRDELSNSTFQSAGRQENEKKSDPNAITDFIHMMVHSYKRIALAIGFAGLAFLTPFLVRPFSEMNEPTYAWFAWLFILIAIPISICSSAYSSYLLGVNAVTVLRRSEFIIGLGAILSSCGILLFFPNLLFLVIAIYMWHPIKWLLLKRICLKHEQYPKRDHLSKKPIIDYSLFRSIWSPSWRGGIGVVCIHGLIQASNLLLAQIAVPVTVASYGLTVSLLSAVSDFSKAPMVSRVPSLIRLHISGSAENFIALARRCMAQSYWAFTISLIGFLMFGEILIDMIGSEVGLAPRGFIALMGYAYFFDRYGAMHQQVYNTSNRVIIHITAIGYALIFLATSYFAINRFGIYAFAAGSLIGHLFFVAVYSARKSYSILKVSFWSFEKGTSIPPLLFITIVCALFLSGFLF